MWRTRLAAILAIAGTLLASSSAILPQRRGGGGQAVFDPTWFYDGGFVFCRVAFRNAPYGDGNGWSVDYPRADLNLPFRAGQLTTIPISRDHSGEPNHVVITLTDP